MIALDLINASMRLAGIGTPGETLSPEDTQIGLDALNELFEDWSLQNLAVFVQTSTTYTLVPGQASYTIGVGGNFNGVRPIQIADMYVRYQTIDYLIKQITNEDYDSIPFKSQQGPFPAFFTYDAGVPLGTITFYMVPNQALPVTVLQNQQLQSAALQSSTLVLPPGYKRALQANLAVDLCNIYDREVPQGIAQMATTSLANIKRANIVPQEIPVDPAFLGGYAGYPGSWYANFIAGNF